MEFKGTSDFTLNKSSVQMTITTLSQQLLQDFHKKAIFSPQVCVRKLMFIDFHNKIELYDKTVINYSDMLIPII